MDADWLDFESSARWNGGQAWVAAQCFEVLGRAAIEAIEDPLAVTLVTASRRHARHAADWRSLLPQLPGFGADELVICPDGPLGTLTTTWSEQLERQSPRKVADFYESRLLPELVRQLEAHRSRLRPVSDAPVIRVLDGVRAGLVGGGA